MVDQGPRADDCMKHCCRTRVGYVSLRVPHLLLELIVPRQPVRMPCLCKAMYHIVALPREHQLQGRDMQSVPHTLKYPLIRRFQRRDFLLKPGHGGSCLLASPALHSPRLSARLSCDPSAPCPSVAPQLFLRRLLPCSRFLLLLLYTQRALKPSLHTPHLLPPQLYLLDPDFPQMLFLEA